MELEGLEYNENKLSCFILIIKDLIKINNKFKYCDILYNGFFAEIRTC